MPHLMATLSKAGRLPGPKEGTALTRHASSGEPLCFWKGTANAARAFTCTRPDEGYSTP